MQADSRPGATGFRSRVIELHPIIKWPYFEGKFRCHLETFPTTVIDGVSASF
jgi:hypothetical protein